MFLCTRITRADCKTINEAIFISLMEHVQTFLKKIYLMYICANTCNTF